MVDEEVSEKTLLTSNPKPRYAFESSITRQRRQKVRQFQCCIYTFFLSIIIIAIIISVLSTLNVAENKANNTLILMLKEWPLSDPYQIDRNYSNANYEDALSAGKFALEERELIENLTPTLDIHSPSYKHQKSIATSLKAGDFARIGYAEEYATRNMNIHSNSTLYCFNNTLDAFYSSICNQQQIKCDLNTKYRSYNGSCNNIEHPLAYGVAYQPFRRILPSDYADGISTPRASSNKKPLPSARTVSQIIHRPVYKEDLKFTIVMAVFGQFLDHDITATALSQAKNNKSISCCSKHIVQQHPECFPVMLDKNDSFYVNFNVTCMEFVRSARSPTCCLGPREQLNQASSYIDGSVIYGSDESVAKKLRQFNDGLLAMTYTKQNRSLLPISVDPSDGCNRIEENEKGRYCFMTGDARANENLYLTTMHLLWARQHNLIADKLKSANAHWDDEKLFQESRKIIGAQLQHITYNEFLPILFGNFMRHLDLTPLTSGYYKGYNRTIEATIANGFAASAFRFAHTLIPSLVKFVSNESWNASYIELHKILFDPYRLYENEGVDDAIRGALHTPIQANDPYFASELKEHLFVSPATSDSANKTKLCGLDLVSLNIQRGRDHGLPGYSSWRQHCGLMRPNTFDELSQDIDVGILRNIKKVYRHVDDIDFYTGALSENPLSASFLGPTITCILLDQFVRLKRGDRFWYENPNIFTTQQLTEIRRTTLAKIICDNSDNVEILQKYVMRTVDEENQLTNCKAIDEVNLNVWKEAHVPIMSNNLVVKHKITTN